jgi:FtsZ-binding cell division protein ZapB
MTLLPYLNSEFYRLTSTLDIGIEGLKRLATQLDQENEALERKYDSEMFRLENVKRTRLTEKVKKLKEKKKQLESKITALAGQMDTEEES